MSKFDYLDLSGRALRQFLVVFEEGSVTKAAARLNVSQSAVSHMLDKLRLIIGDPLFVAAGRGIVATTRAEQLAVEVRPLLAGLEQLTILPLFDPAGLDGEVTIGADDYQRELLLPGLVQILRRDAPGLDLKVINSGVASADLLRQDRCDLLITPDPPEGTEFVQRKLFEDHWVCFHDPSTPPPLTLDQYLARPHAKVVFSENERSRLDVVLGDMAPKRRIALRVVSFSALSRLMRGTDLVIALPRLIERTFMQGFAIASLPVQLPPLAFHMAWHLSKSLSPCHQWLRSSLRSVVNELSPPGAASTHEPSTSLQHQPTPPPNHPKYGTHGIVGQGRGPLRLG